MANIGKEIDKLDALDREVSKLEAILKKVERKFHDQELKVMALLQESELPAATGSEGLSVKIEEKEHYNIKDRSKLEAWAAKNDALDIFQSRINQRAYLERVEAGIKVPGIGKYTSVKLKLNRSRKNG